MEDDNLTALVKKTMGNVERFMTDEVKNREALERKVNILGLGGSSKPSPERRVVGPDEMKSELLAWYPGREQMLRGFDNAACDDYKAAVPLYLRHGYDALGPDQRKALSVGIDPQGGLLVFSDMRGRMIERVRELSPIRQFANVQPTASDRLEGIADLDEADSGWVGETQSRPETDSPEIGKYEIVVHEIYAAPKATQKIIDDASNDIEAWLLKKIANRIARQEAAAFISGNGILKPRGILSYPVATTVDASRAWGTLQYVASGHASTFITPTTSASPADCLIDMVYAMKAAYRAGSRWYMNSATAGVVRKFRDVEGRFIWSDAIVSGQPPLLLGYPVTFCEDLADVGANAYPIMFANLDEAYLIADRMGIRVLRDPYSVKPYVIFYATMRVGGSVVNFEALKLLKVATS